LKTAENHKPLKTIAAAIFNAGIKAVDPAGCVGRHLQLAAGELRVGQTSHRLDETGKLLLIGAGKASAAMARSAERLLAIASTPAW
jgi:glycerate 2-kinase